MHVKTLTNFLSVTSPILPPNVLFPLSRGRSLLRVLELSSLRLLPRLRRMLSRPFWPWRVRLSLGWRHSLVLLLEGRIREEFLSGARLSMKSLAAVNYCCGCMLGPIVWVFQLNWIGIVLFRFAFLSLFWRKDGSARCSSPFNDFSRAFILGIEIL